LLLPLYLSAYGLSIEIGWHQDYPCKSSLTGQTCREPAGAYEADTGKQWVTDSGIQAAPELSRCTRRSENPPRRAGGHQRAYLDQPFTLA
jgi:hypothetical protein